ncbi:hypothetical protein H2198_004203 [Neophaeococcomyces mojaviensis]|uniref:Uncharacterized protein n=1 Tax=Neophaeococcomyces mojaviensis TaxID=3383035 RepID=A0ACC3A9E8_9EURO|nr:hypothetical protein H2198_004203 [Knufia sp. JES_112]
MTNVPFHTAFPISASRSEEALADTKLTTSDSEEGSSDTVSPLESSSVEAVPLMLEAPNSQAQPPASVTQQRKTPRRSVPRLNTRASVSRSSLPWQTDKTSSPFTPTSHGRRLSFAPPPRSNADSYCPSISGNPELSQFQSAMASNHGIYQFSSPCTPSPGSVIDLSHPPGYSQDAEASFSDKPPYENHTPFYKNSYSSSFSSPQTPTRRGRGILDNDPAIYLGGEGDGEEDSVWDTAARWAKAAGKRLSESEQQIWKMVNAISTGENDR